MAQLLLAEGTKAPEEPAVPRLGYDPTRIDPGSILDQITKDRKDRSGLSQDRSLVS